MPAKKLQAPVSSLILFYPDTCETLKFSEDKVLVIGSLYLSHMQSLWGKGGGEGGENKPEWDAEVSGKERKQREIVILPGSCIGSTSYCLINFVFLSPDLEPNKYEFQHLLDVSKAFATELLQLPFLRVFILIIKNVLYQKI